MFARGSFRYPYIVRLMGAGALLCLASIPGTGSLNGDQLVQNYFTIPVPCLNEWLIGDGWDPPGSTEIINFFEFSGEGIVPNQMAPLVFTILLTFVIICLADIINGVAISRYIIYDIFSRIYVITSDDGSEYMVVSRCGMVISSPNLFVFLNLFFGFCFMFFEFFIFVFLIVYFFNFFYSSFCSFCFF